MCARSAYLVVGVLLVSTLLSVGLLESTPLVKTIDVLLHSQILNSESEKTFEKFFGKANVVAEQFVNRVLELLDADKFIVKSHYAANKLTTQLHQADDTNNPTLIVLLTTASSFVLIRFENEKIKFYNVQKIVSFVFIIILLSSSIITPFAYSASYGVSSSDKPRLS